MPGLQGCAKLKSAQTPAFSQDLSVSADIPPCRSALSMIGCFGEGLSGWLKAASIATRSTEQTFSDLIQGSSSEREREKCD